MGNKTRTCGANGSKNGSLSGFIINRPNNSAAEQCQTLIEELNIPITALTARSSLTFIIISKLLLHRIFK